VASHVVLGGGLPVVVECDWVLDNVYAISIPASFKTLAIGRLAAQDMANGGEQHLGPFRLDRFARGALHTASRGPYPRT
jgi:hypothetical protein